MVKDRLHGMVTLALVGISLVVGLIVVYSESFLFGSLYLVILLLGMIAVLYGFCAKCPCRENSCAHFFPGKAVAWFPKRSQGKYSSLDYVALGGSLTLIFAYPQYWLWKSGTPFFLFWSMCVVAFVDIRLFVCSRCGNRYCPSHKERVTLVKSGEGNKEG